MNWGVANCFIHNAMWLTMLQRLSLSTELQIEELTTEKSSYGGQGMKGRQQTTEKKKFKTKVCHDTACIGSAGIVKYLTIATDNIQSLPK